MGINYHLAVEVLGSGVDYTVVELSEICKKGRIVNPKVRFLENIPHEKFDIVIMCAVLPYLPNYESIISEIDAEYLYLAKAAVTDKLPFLVRQRLPGGNYENWRVFNKSDVLSSLESLGYAMKREFLVNLLNPGTVNRIKNSPSNTYYGSWLFKKSSFNK